MSTRRVSQRVASNSLLLFLSFISGYDRERVGNTARLRIRARHASRAASTGIRRYKSRSPRELAGFVLWCAAIRHILSAPFFASRI
jgi:hypothetical protein